MRILQRFVSPASLGLTGALCALVTATWVSAQPRATVAGDPLPGLTAVEFQEFRLGLDDFTEVEETEEGLGPAFNGTSCGACHNVPAVGGTGTVTELRAGRLNERGEFEALDPSGGGETLFQTFSVPAHGCQAIVPAAANVIARRVAIPLFGAGLVEAIPDDTIRALEDPFDRNGDEISGRASIIVDAATREQRVGRFGWKAQHATLFTFGADAYRNEMGITNDVFATELAIAVSPERMRRCDPIPEPEDKRDPRTGRRGIDNFASFMRFLAPLGRGEVDDGIRAGERMFGALGCAGCHVPSLTTGASSNPVFDRKVVPLFSDLLLHDVGTGDGIKQASAEPNEIRTPALWGLRFRRPLLHDGSVATIDEAIRHHAREAELARRGFERLTDAERTDLLAFLLSL
jgi:CxxC motif-containing protein (DUF1111 family)